MNKYQLNKTIFSVDSINSRKNDKLYWLSKTPLERLEFVEYLRQINYGYDQATSRLQRFLEVADLNSIGVNHEKNN